MKDQFTYAWDIGWLELTWLPPHGYEVDPMVGHFVLFRAGSTAVKLKWQDRKILSPENFTEQSQQTVYMLTHQKKNDLCGKFFL